MEGEENNDSREVSLTVKNVTYSGTLTRGENSKWSGKLNGSGGYHHLDIKEGTLGSDGTLNWGIVNIATITYTGQIRDGKLSGLGRLDRPGGYYESGTFVDGNISKGEVKTLKWDDGSVYEGAYSGGMFNGLGLKKGMNGDYEDGEFKNGSFSGNGKVRITDPSDGSVYEGEYSNKSHNGYGKITHKNGCSMEGEFVNGKERNVILEKKSPDGKSAFTHIIYDENGNPVLVQKLDKKPGSVGKKFDFENLGKIVNPLVVPTTSERKKNNRDGKSEEETVEIELSDSITYAGGYKDGKFEGWGTLKDRDGNIVRQGTFEKSIFKEGQAIVHNSDGSTYDGSIRDGKFEGRGTLMDQDGNIVRQGTFEKGIFKEGQAIVHNPDGTTYEGPIKDGKYWGEGGKLVFLNGDYRKGSFTDGSFSGTGEAKTTNFDGSTYEGYCSEWKSHGQGLWKDMAGNYRKGEFKENVLVEGKVGTVDGLNGCIRERDSRGGNLGDYFKITYKDGYSMEGEFFKDGKAQNVVIEKKSLDGRSTFTHFIYDENGNVLRRKELEEKPSRGTDERLNLVELEQFPKKLTPINTDRATKDEFERETVVIKFNGGNTYEGKYKNGEFDGNGVLKDEDGKIIKSGTFEKGIFKEGQAIVHNSDGTTYEGHVVGEIYSGLGKLVYPNGDYLEGNFSGGFFTEGKMRKANNIDGSVYEGEANRGVNGIIGYYGSGRLSYPNGDYQEGNFSGGFFTEGKIRKTNSDGSVYEGGGSQWQKYNGYGTLLSKDGSLLYRGEYVGGMQQGYGKHMYSHGCSAEGEFVNGRARNVILEKKSPDGGLAFIHIIYDDYGNVLLSKELEEKPGRTENGKLDFSGLDKLEDPPMEVQPITLDDVVEGADASGEVRIAYKDGSVYTGEVDGDCRPNGVGEWIGPGGELREGTFENGKFKSGTVVMKLSKNVTYAGKYENGKFNGKGTLKDGDGKVIKDGKFKEGEFMEGQATVHNPDGTTYEGPIKGGKYEGEGGKLVFPNGDHQAGEFQDDSFCSGTVRITNSDGSLYEGGCYNKKREGYGKLVYGDGCSVEGDFMNGEARSVILEKKSPDGKSTFIHAVYDRSGNMLLRQKLSEKPDCGKDKELKLQDLEKPKEPLMKVSSDILGAANELADGKTKIAYRDGSIYIGAVDGNGMPNGDGEWTGPGEESRKGIFKDGEFKSGTVKIAFSDSVTYEGGYSDGKFNGKGVLKDKEGKYLKDGIFKDGKFDVGEVIVEDSRGVSYQGHVEGGKYNGKGKVTSPNGDYREGDFTNGEFVKGQVKITSPGGFFYEGGYSNGKYQGYGKLRYVGGRFSVEGEFLDGKAKEVLVEKKSEISTKSTFLHLVYDDHGNMVVRQELDKKPDYVDGRLNFDASWAEKPEKPLMEVPSGIGKVTDKGNGKKEITYKDGTVYVGDADGNNMPDGNGKLTYLGGDVRDGAFKNGRFKSGNVVMKLSESIIYEGEYSNGRFDGKGSLKDTESKRSETKELDRERMPTERRYKYLEDGSFENGKFREGEVVVDNLDWTTYIGYIRDGVRDGSGELQRYGCELIDGKFSSDVLVDGNASLIFNSSVSISDSDMANRFLCPGGKAYLYSGEIRNGKYSGHGEWTNWLTEIYYDPAKNYRKGTFRDGKLIDGSEFIKDNNGERKGTVKDGLFNTGNAKITNADGSIYEGSYRDGKYNGSGKLVYKNGVSVEGEFEDGRARNVIQEITSADSKKTFAYIIFDEDGNVLLRQELEKEPERVDEKLDFSTLERPKEPRMVVPITLKDNRDSREEVEDGEIRIVYADDSVYVGEVNDRDRPNGKGKWIGPGGESREGIFKNGKFESGTVVMKFGDNITYAGGYKNGKFDGKGKVKDTGGKVIKDGTFKNGKFMKGKAIVYNPDGTTYEGYIKNGMYSNGKLIKLNGDYEAGDFVDGSFSGKGMVRISNSDDDSVYEGGYSNEKYHGYGKLIKKNGDIAEGEFSNGQEMKIFKTKKIGNIHYYQVFNEESRSYSYRMLDGELERDEQDEQKKFKMDDDSLAKLKPFWENDGGANTKYYFYGDGTEVKTIIEMDAAKANDLLSSGKATNLK
ncbi:MAG: hypothetical protein LBU15_02390, partial [Rickettsiales bacterium]|nr:hypothetical protein [Rickettsiales bacterium]